MSKIAKLFTALLGIATGHEYIAASNCRVCGRALTNPASVLAGIGPTCAHGKPAVRDERTIDMFGLA
jgi:hypothetical protein